MGYSFAHQDKIIIFAQNHNEMIMCNSNEFIKEIIDYIRSVLDEKVTLSPLEKHLSDAIPIAITQNFKLYKGELLGHAVIFALTNDGNDMSPALLKRTFNLIENKCGCPVILVTDNIASYNIGRLTAQRSNFIVPKKQMFIPSLLVDLKKTKASGTDIKETIPPIAQCLVLYHLEVKSIDRYEAKDLMEIFPVSYATINRALRWLSEKGLVSLEGKKTKEIRLVYHGKELWEMAMPLLVSPVEKTVYCDSIPETGLMCGINALSEYTMINREYQDMFAVGKVDMHQSNISTDREYGAHRIEVWKYAPKMLSHTGTVDKLSLYLSLKDNEDERVQIELDNLINEIKW